MNRVYDMARFAMCDLLPRRPLAGLVFARGGRYVERVMARSGLLPGGRFPDIHSACSATAPVCLR